MMRTFLLMWRRSYGRGDARVEALGATGAGRHENVGVPCVYQEFVLPTR